MEKHAGEGKDGTQNEVVRKGCGWNTTAETSFGINTEKQAN